ncbi:MAG TPA: lysoplasmalogenase [Chitinophagaceae bacterium]|nr:lysoplasmalogenase [Chitinophagaceae bacterium]
MKKNPWTIPFAIVLAAHLLALLLRVEMMDRITKPLIVITVAGYFFYATKDVQSRLKVWIGSALLFSWGGDILLMFQDKKSLFFLLGLSSFLLAHIFYIIFLHKVRLAEKIKPRLWTLLVVAIYYSVLITFLSPWLGDMRLPVRVYGMVISFMLLLALHLLFLANRKAGLYIAIGAILFVLSDSLLAINKFYQPFEAAGFLIMLTYGLAQLFLIIGASNYLNTASSRK